MHTSKRVVPQQFVDDFDLVAARYNLRELGEYDAAKAAARNDLNSAVTAFTSLAEEIRRSDAGHAQRYQEKQLCLMPV